MRSRAFVFSTFLLMANSLVFSQSNQVKISDEVASVRVSEEYWSQYVIVENNSLDYPIKVEIDVVYSIVFRRNEPDYEKTKKLYSNIISPMQRTNVYLNVKGNYIVRAEKLYVRTYTSEGKPHDKVLTIIIH